ncbi:flagellar hook capping FlgD N-terminal domain-containing protein [Ramlibacter sp. WS9]|uniref:flagellar hook capping FlgD N-terminal domain-containing protein n=1 Tax=Ramlibacter sp. WS9 TaxID=1882741 RepID=UPI0011424314|nr:flagellar hook capping FlgD N-terminal domain-containing protein [Ramlibacter sp. WS9]ROZ63196.1 flagellar hook capping protein [Ramlibacter sp. WS9]
MTISSVSSSASTTQANPMGMEDFLKILLTQLTYQDPLKPMDNQEFMAQMAQFTSLEQTQQLNEKMSTLISNQAALQSVGLIGRTVDITSSSGVAVTGQVTALSLTGEAPALTITTTGGATLTNVSLSQITAVR